MQSAGLGEPADPTLILGLGNPLRGDDGIGPRVLEQLKHHDLPSSVKLVDGGTGGLEMALEFAGKSTVIVIDAARFGGQAGEYRRFDLLTTELARTNWGAGHAHGLGAAIELARALEGLPKRLILYAIEPGDVETPLCISSAVERAVPLVVAAVLGELGPRELP